VCIGFTRKIQIFSINHIFASRISQSQIDISSKQERKSLNQASKEISTDEPHQMIGGSQESSGATQKANHSTSNSQQREIVPREREKGREREKMNANGSGMGWIIAKSYSYSLLFFGYRYG
jgi:hypothetical protein